MAQHAEFEEKEYENPLNIELLFNKSTNIWAPGQVFEEHFGIDSALLATHPTFWKLFNPNHSKIGISLNDFNWGYIMRKVNKKRPLPKFKTNLLLQVKRPEHRLGVNSKYAVFGIDKEYWQFKLTNHQQKALEKLSEKISTKALICYASPAFHLLEDLYKNIENSTLIQNSTFVQAIKLRNHTKWVYNKAGTTGLACSKVEKISDKDLLKSIEILSKDQSDDQINSSPILNLQYLVNEIVSSIRELPQTNVVRNEFQRRLRVLSEINYNVEYHSKEIELFQIVNIYCTLTNTTWYVIN